MSFLANFDLNQIQYMLFIFLLLMLEAGVTADVVLNRDWEEACSLTKNSLFDSHLMVFRLQVTTNPY